MKQRNQRSAKKEKRVSPPDCWFTSGICIRCGSYLVSDGWIIWCVFDECEDSQGREIFGASPPKHGGR